MGKRQKQWAAKVRDQLFDVLGWACAKCGATKKLEFDCIQPRGHTHHKYDWSHRMSFYRREHAAGNLQVLCATCNALKGNVEKNSVDSLPTAPP